jgi:hypothetical protein
MLTLVLLCPLFTGTAAAGSMPMKACELITAKDVETILGSGFAPQDVLDTEITSTCAYVKNKVGVVSVTLTRDSMSAAQLLQIQQAGFKQQGLQVTPVSGLGESAYYVINSESDFVLNFGRGNLRVMLAESGGKPNIEAALKLARMAYPRLK